MIMAAAPASEQVLNPFNEILNLRRAYTYDRQQVSESLYDAAEVVGFPLHRVEADHWNGRYSVSFTMWSIMDIYMMFKIVDCHRVDEF